MIPENGDRLISASEVERWCYCPMSWKLERSGGVEDRTHLEDGERKHLDIGKEAGSVLSAQSTAGENTATTWVFLAFSTVFLLMGVSLLVLTGVGSLDIDIWRAGVIFTSVVMVSAALAYYFGFRGFSRKLPGKGLMIIVRKIDSKNWKRVNNPLLFYFYGLILMLNGIVLLRPFGIRNELISTILAISMIFLYALLLITVALNFRSYRFDTGEGEIRIGMPLVLMLVISLSVLFILLSDHLDSGGNLGWIFLLISLLWFMSALVYDFYIKLKEKKVEGIPINKIGGKSLHIASLALLASVFTASTFLAKGNNLGHYYLASVVIAGAWLVGAIFFFWRASFQKRSASSGMSKLSLPGDSRMISADRIDDRRGTRPMVSRKHFLIGTPDIMIEENGFHIPVEVKTGRIPVKPFFSHVMQLGSYMILSDVKYNQQTPYGYLEYAPSKTERKRFRIEQDLMTRALVLSKVSEIREAERTGVVHRNHNREGKCRNCSRREGCPESLV